MEFSPKDIKWIAVDWGTTNLRAWVMGTENEPLHSLDAPHGMATLGRDEFEPALIALIGPYLSANVVIPVICCGMVGSRQGWAEASYLTSPCAPPIGTLTTRASVKNPRIAVFILPGIKQIKPADVMRGEETQVAGYLQQYPDFDGVICLPGTHTKWVHISAGEIVSFQTFMTGELFSLLSYKSILRHSIAADGWDSAAYLEGVEDAMSRPQSVAAQLFGIRAASLIADLSCANARSRLSGLLIGIELAAARPYWLGRNVALIGADAIAGLYADALNQQGVNTSMADTQKMTLLGLAAAKNSLKDLAN
ncbi:MAG: 2-dehydro-3-deoxygalactonokinase [Paracoccaceae bacterium]